jgi:hypothetical protein
MANAREFLWIVKESALGTVMTSPVAGTDSIYIRLIDGNSFTMTTEPVFEEIPYGGGFAVTAEALSDHYGCKGHLKTKLYPAQAALLLSLLAARVNAGQTTPWVTTEPPGDLASVSVYHAIQFSDGTIRRKRYAGCKAAGGRIEVSRQSTTAMLKLDLQACRSYGNAMDSSSDPDATEFPAPSETDYPTGPYTFKNTSTKLKIGTTRAQYESISIAVQNALDGRWFEQSYLTVNKFCGRKTRLDAELYFKPSPDNRAAYEALTAQDAELTFDNGTHTAKVDFNGQNTIMKLDYNLPLNQAFTEKLSLTNRFDPSTPALDLTLSFT